MQYCFPEAGTLFSQVGAVDLLTRSVRLFCRMTQIQEIHSRSRTTGREENACERQQGWPESSYNCQRRGLVVDVLERVKVMGSALAERRRRSLYGRPTEGHKAYSKISSGHV